MLQKMIAMGIVLAAMSMSVYSCSTDTKNELKVTQNVAIRVGDKKIMEKEVEKRYDMLPDAQKKDYAGLEGKAKFADMIIEEQLILAEALEKGIDKEKSVEEKLDNARTAVLVTEYYNREIVGKIEVNDSDIESYYENHKEEFVMRAVLRAQHIFSKDSLKCVEWKKRLDAGEDFDKIAKNESEDPVTAVTDGSLGYFNPDGYIKSVGYSPRFGAAVEKLEVGKISDVIPFEKGYSIVKLNEKTDEYLQPLSEARKRIVEKLQGLKAKETYAAEVERLRNKYKPDNYYRELAIKTKKTPQEIWEKAQLETDPYQRVQYYRDLVNQYPDDNYAPQALFMIGFVYAEEVQDLVSARRTFDELLDSYPNSDVVESAKWMIENMNKPHPKFESIEGMQEHMQEE